MKKRLLTILLSSIMTVSTLCGCSLSLSTSGGNNQEPESEEDAQLRAMGIINFEGFR